MYGVAAGVIFVGTVFKTVYFQFSRTLMIDDMTARHVRAKSHLKEAREHARWAAEDREKRAPKLTEEQRAQLKKYLALMAENNAEVHPKEEGAYMPTKPRARSRANGSGRD